MIAPGTSHDADPASTLGTALLAHRRGLVPIPLRPHKKAPSLDRWPLTAYADEGEVHSTFEEHEGNIGLLLGARGGDLVDVDIDLFPATASRQQGLPAAM